MSRRRRRRWAHSIGPADQRRRHPVGLTWEPNRGPTGRRRRVFAPSHQPLSSAWHRLRQAVRRRREAVPPLRFKDGSRQSVSSAWDRTRQAVRQRRESVPPLRFKRTTRPAKAPQRRPPRQPRMRPRKSVVERVLPTGEPAPPRTVIRLRVMGLVMAVLFSLMFVRLWYLQVLDSKGFAQAVSANQIRDVEVPAPRGLILDRSGQATLVGNQYREDITLSRVSAQQHPEVLGALGALLGISPAQIQSDLSNPQYSVYKPVPVLEDAPMSDVIYIDEHPSQFPGVSAVTETQRTYPMCQTNPPGQCETGVQMLGYVDQINSPELAAHKNQGYELGDLYGQSGLENEYQSVLRGSPGEDEVEVDAQGQVVGTLGQTPTKPGDDLVTNIDAGLEQTLQTDLDSEMAKV
ncbi:MAG TPA: hypothetical protein VEJ21_03590, partial [Acidimicrobiales bacterium]|nr:hypothetical protein [Acidimicrobiales bacterium]